MKRVALYISVALLAVSFGSLAVYFWQSNQPPPQPLRVGWCGTVVGAENPAHLVIGLLALFLSLPSLLMWCFRFFSKRNK